MNGSNLIRLLGLLGGVALADIVILSPGLLGVEIGGDNVLQTAAGVTVLVVSFLVVVYGSYSLLFQRPAVRPVKQIQSYDDYREALEHYRHIKVLKNDVSLAIDQVDRIGKKKLTLLNVLGQRFDPTELSYKKFQSVVGEVEALFYLNVRGMLNNLSVFDASGVSALAGSDGGKGAAGGGPFSNKLVQEKTALYNEYVMHVSGYIGANEEILLKLDRLLLEISRLDSIDYQDIEEMPGMKEIDSLIKQTKYYKQ